MCTDPDCPEMMSVDQQATWCPCGDDQRRLLEPIICALGWVRQMIFPQESLESFHWKRTPGGCQGLQDTVAA